MATCWVSMAFFGVFGDDRLASGSLLPATDFVHLGPTMPLQSFSRWGVGSRASGRIMDFSRR